MKETVMPDIETTERPFDARFERVGAFTDIRENGRVKRVWWIVGIPLSEVQAAQKAAVEAKRLVLLRAADDASLRPQRAVLAGTAVAADHEKLLALESRAQAVRVHAAGLVAAIAAADTAEEAATLDLDSGWPP